MNPDYIVITSAKDEEEYIEDTISSMISQTIKPIEWIIVDDGSRDRTGYIIDKYASRYQWIKAIHRKDRGFRQAGSGVMESFYDGYHNIASRNWDFIVKLDGDLSFQKDYFERCFELFASDSRLGISGGGICHIVNGKPELEEDPVFHVRGATKIYRKACWDDIGGLYILPGWDTLDELKAHMMGWKTKGFAGLQVIHHRYTGGADGTWRNWVKNGLANYISGYHPLFMLLKCVKRLIEKPYVIASLGLIYGYAGGYIRRIPQVDDKALIRYIRQEQIKRILFRKSIWK